MYGMRTAAACSAPSFYLSAWSCHNKSHAAIAWTLFCIPSCSFYWLLLRLSCCSSTAYSWALNLSITLALLGHSAPSLTSQCVLSQGFDPPWLGTHHCRSTVHLMGPDVGLKQAIIATMMLLLCDFSWGQSWNLDSSFQGCTAVWPCTPGPKLLWNSVASGLAPLLHYPTPHVAEASNKHRPQFHGSIISACPLETGPSAPASTVVPQGQSDITVPCEPDLRSLAPLPFWVPVCISSVTANFRQPKSTVGPQKPLLPSTSMALATTTLPVDSSHYLCELSSFAHRRPMQSSQMLIYADGDAGKLCSYALPRTKILHSTHLVPSQPIWGENLSPTKWVQKGLRRW